MCGRACRGGEEGEARSVVLYSGSLTVPRVEAAGTRGRGVPGDDAWHWNVLAPDTVSTLPIGSPRALSSEALHPAPSPWVELGSTQYAAFGVVCAVCAGAVSLPPPPGGCSWCFAVSSVLCRGAAVCCGLSCVVCRVFWCFSVLCCAGVRSPCRSVCCCVVLLILSLAVS